MRKLALLTLLFGFIFSACRPNVEVANWDVQALTPILKTRIDINNLLADTTVKVDANGLISVVFRNKIANLKPGEIAPPFNEVFTNTANIQSIELGSRTINEKITLGQMAANAGIIGQLILASHGTNQVIPALNGLGPNLFNVDATQFFQTMTLRDGYMVLRLQNNLPIELQNIQYQIGNQGAVTPLLQNTIPSLMPNAVHFDSVRLQNNVVITGQLVANLISIDSPGSNGSAVPIDTNDAIDLRFTIDKLDPVSATAIFPAQNLVEDTATANILPPSALLTKVHVAEGLIYMDATSTIDDEISLQYSIPGATKNGTSLGFLEIIPAAPFGGTSQRRAEVPVVGYDIDLTGIPGSSNVFNEFYTVFITRVDSSGRLINLALTDSVYIETGIDQLVTDRGYGFLGFDSIYSNETSAIEAFSSLGSGQINLQSAKLELEIDNFIGARMDLKLISAQGERDNQSLALNWDKLGDVLPLGRASENTPGTKPTPQRSTFILDETNSNIAQVLSLQPKTFALEIEAYMNSGVSNSDLSQFLYTDYGIDAYLNAEIPLNLSFNNIEFTDTQAFNYQEFDPKARLQSGALKIIGNNFYPFQAQVDILLLNDEGMATDTLSAGEPILAAEIDADGRASKAVETTLTYPLALADIVRLKGTNQLVFQVTFNTNPGAGAVKFYSDNFLDLQLIGDLTLSTK